MSVSQKLGCWNASCDDGARYVKVLLTSKMLAGTACGCFPLHCILPWIALDGDNPGANTVCGLGVVR